MDRRNGLSELLISTSFSFFLFSFSFSVALFKKIFSFDGINSLARKIDLVDLCDDLRENDKKLELRRTTLDVEKKKRKSKHERKINLKNVYKLNQYRIIINRIIGGEI